MHVEWRWRLGLEWGRTEQHVWLMLELFYFKASWWGIHEWRIGQRTFVDFISWNSDCDTSMGKAMALGTIMKIINHYNWKWIILTFMDFICLSFLLFVYLSMERLSELYKKLLTWPPLYYAIGAICTTEKGAWTFLKNRLIFIYILYHHAKFVVQ